MKHRTIRTILLAALAAGRTFALAQDDGKTLFFISNTHLDTQWNWEVTHTINEYIKNTLTQNMALMDKYPNFRLNYEGAVKYMWMKEYYPAEFERMKRYVADGRWHVSGMSVDAGDVIISSAESILHSMLYANRFYRDELGVRGGYDIMLPDCFGFSYALPSLARHAGIRGFHTAKLAWGSAAYDRLPPFGLWQGVDGSRIWAIYKPGAYDSHEEFNKDLTQDDEWLKKIDDNMSRYGVPMHVRYVGPRSDRGGGLKDDASSSGENTPYWLDYMASREDGKFKVRLGTPDEVFDFLDAHRNTKIPVWNSELPMRTHGVGAYTSWGMLKRWNRRNELAADAAEKASGLAHWLGAAPYPSESLREAWVRTLWQQHHDGITGTSTLKANDYSTNEYYIANRAFARELTNAAGAVSQLLDTSAEGTPVVVYNPLSHERTDVVECTLACPTRPAAIRVCGPDGGEVLSQITGYDRGTGQLRFIFAATVPSLGCAVYDVQTGAGSQLTSPLSADASARVMSNGRISVTINSNGDISRVYDNANSRSLINSAVRQQMIYDHEDTWPAWEISYTDVCRTPSAYVGAGGAEVTLVEDGPLRKSFRVYRQKDGSTFVQYIRMTALSDRIDCVNEVDWQTPERMLKVQFPFAFSNSKATYDISLGTVTRGVRTDDEYEVAAHQWADHGNMAGRYGVSILSDCKYGWDKPANNTLRLTLLHTPSCKNYDHQANMDLGPNAFTYSIFPHEGAWGEATQMEAARLNQPLLAFAAPRHGGELGKTLAFATPGSNRISIKALKKAEDTDELIVRVYEWTGADLTGETVTFPAPIVSAREVDALEETVGEALAEGNTLRFDIGRYQPKTFAVRLAPRDGLSPAPTGGTPARFTPNVDVMSYDAARGNATSGYALAYPAELVPDTLTADGVRFAMGPRTNGKPNALRLYNSTLTLEPREGETGLYLLMASAAEDGSDVKVTLGAAGDTVIHVPYWSGRIGTPLTCTNLEEDYRRENVALALSHAHSTSGRQNEAMTMMYAYKYRLPLPEGVTQVKLTSPDRRALLLSAATSACRADDITPLTPLTTEIGYGELPGLSDDGRLEPSSVAASHQNGTGEAGKMAADRNAQTKWCVTGAQSETPTLTYNFTQPVRIDRWMVLGAARESGGYVARAFKLEYLADDGTWKEADAVKDNQLNKVTRMLAEPVTTRKVRLHMAQGEQNGTTTRIYEFAVYGMTQADYEDDILAPASAHDDPLAPVYDISGRRYDSPHLPKGIYIRGGRKVAVQ